MKSLEGSGFKFNLAIYVRVFAIFGAHVRIHFAPKYCNFFMMSKNTDQVYYAVGKGKEVGIYNTWSECKEQIEGIPNAKYRKFFSIKEAQEFLDFWKSYSSPSLVSSQKSKGWSDWKNRKNLKKKPVLSSDKNLDHLTGKKRENYRRQSSAYCSKWDPPTFLRKTDNILGPDTNSGDKSLVPSLHYTSPISCIKISPFYYKSGGERNISSSPKSQECVVGELKKSNSVDDIVIVEHDLKFEVDDDTPTATTIQSSTDTPQTGENFISENSENILPTKENIPPNGGNIFNTCEKVSEVPKIFEFEVIPKKENVETELNNETEVNQREEGELSENNKSASLLESVQLILEQTSVNSEEVKKVLLLLLQKVMPGTNININPQMDVEENNTRTDEARNEETNCENNNLEQQSSPAAHPSPDKNISQQSCVGLSTPFEGRKEQKNVDVLALTLRLDAFERRFDSCLKEIGAITSEISHIKSELKEIREVGGSGGGTPVKRGMLQTTLKFGSPNKLESTSPSRYYSTDNGETSSGEPKAKQYGRSLKRKLSRSDSFKDEACDDILSRIKVEAVDYTSFLVDSDEYVEVYTDGACLSNGQKGARAGIGIWWGDNHPLNVSEPVEGSPTNNVAEIQAATIAIELAIKAGLTKLKVCTDSEFLINCITKWIHRWKKNNWTLSQGGKVKNRKEFEKLDKLSTKIKIRWKKVEAHTGIHGNEMADRLANEGAEKYQR